jgi:hypothetical protein
MRALKAFLLGAVGIGIVAYALVAALAVAAQADGRTLEIAIGPVLFVSVAVEGTAKVTTFGLGLLVVALLGGILNLVAAQLIRRRP